METTKFISVKDSYPEDYPELLLSDSEKIKLKHKIYQTKEVEIKYQDGHVEIGRRYRMWSDDYSFWINKESFDKNNPLFITSWRPIQPLPLSAPSSQSPKLKQ